MISGKSLGRQLSVEDFRKMPEREQYQRAAVEVETRTHLKKARFKAKKDGERQRSWFGWMNMKGGLKRAGKAYDAYIKTNQ